MTEKEVKTRRLNALFMKLTKEGRDAARDYLEEKAHGREITQGVYFDDGWILDAAYTEGTQGNHETKTALYDHARKCAELRRDYVRAAEIARLSGRLDLIPVYQTLEKLLD